MADIYSVEAVNTYIRDVLQADDLLQDVWVNGEVSNMKAAASGHWYFTLKDSKSQLKCVMFRASAERQFIEPKDGEAIRVHGKISVYEARGEYQLYADELQSAGSAGSLYLQFEALKAKLLAEGLFDTERKRDLPLFPQVIGVVTSPDAAAFRDVQNVLARRYPLAEILLSPTLVQGLDAPPQIVRAIERINQQASVDVLLIIRGGGSIEDLWAFNDERVARAIAASQIPTISGVGHETDFTIADFVADVRAPTPSAAAEIATPNQQDLRLSLERANQILAQLSLEQVAKRQNNLKNLSRRLDYQSPERRILNLRQRLDEGLERLTQQQKRRLALWRERLKTRQKALDAANPETLLARGYAIVTRSEDAHVVTQVSDAPIGTGISIQLKNGEIKARVEDKDSHGQYKRTLF